MERNQFWGGPRSYWAEVQTGVNNNEGQEPTRGPLSHSQACNGIGGTLAVGQSFSVVFGDGQLLHLKWCPAPRGCNLIRYWIYPALSRQHLSRDGLILIKIRQIPGNVGVIPSRGVISFDFGTFDNLVPLAYGALHIKFLNNLSLFMCIPSIARKNGHVSANNRVTIYSRCVREQGRWSIMAIELRNYQA